VALWLLDPTKLAYDRRQLDGRLS